MKLSYQELKGKNLFDSLQKAEGRIYSVDYEYNLHKILFELINEYCIDIRWIHFEENFKQYPKFGNWLAGMFTSDKISKWKTAYGETPEEAIMRVFVRVKLGDKIEIEDE
jgi:hypothetical protein